MNILHYLCFRRRKVHPLVSFFTSDAGRNRSSQECHAWITWANPTPCKWPSKKDKTTLTNAIRKTSRGTRVQRTQPQPANPHFGNHRRLWEVWGCLIWTSLSRLASIIRLSHLIPKALTRFLSLTTPFWTAPYTGLSIIKNTPGLPLPLPQCDSTHVT